MRRILSILILFLGVYFPMAGYAQVTTGTITGTVKATGGEMLTGATVTAVHEPTGSKYVTVAKSNGQFTLPNVKVGGPYTVTIHYEGYSDGVYNDMNVALGSPLVIESVLEVTSKTLGEVKVTAARKGAVISSQRTGASTYISQKMIQAVPTINRSVQDFARFTPQASPINDGGDGTSRGITFGGQNNRYNAFSVDGANATDAFGLTSSGTNGGQANINPIPVEAIQEMQVVLSPYDVTQGGFTGAGINAITKSGTNNFHGSVYGFYQNEGFIGKSVLTRLKFNSFKNETYGASVGGAIVKNKLFFYVNAERYERSTPLGSDPSQAGTDSKFNVDTLEALRQFVVKNYGYDPGGYKTINKQNSSTTVFGRLDWNISEKSKLTLRHSYVTGSNDLISRSSTAITFSNGSYRFVNTTNSTVLELNTNFSSNSSNVLRVVYNAIRDHRATPFFPTLTIYNAGLTYNVGSDNSSQVNVLNQDNFTLTDNFTLYKGKHTITLGTNNEFYNTMNLFLQNYYGNYQYGASSTTTANNNITAFETNTAQPNFYNVGYSTSSDPSDKAAAKLHAAQIGVYGQDVLAVNDRFKLTYGLRIDMPVYFNKPATNTAFDNDPNFYMFKVRTEQMPKARPLWSPRVGFNWDVKGNAKTQLRGGAGLFTGRIPFVWISNQLSNTGVTNIAYQANSNTNAAFWNTVRFHYNPNDVHAGAQIPSNATAPTTTINVIDRNFKFPQVFRANLALDQKLPFGGLIGTVEAVFTKTVNNANYQNLNLTYFPDSTVKLGTGANSVRPFWTKRITNAYNDVIELTNTSKGYAYNFTFQLQKPYEKGWSGSLAYTYGHSVSLSDLTSSVAYSNWRFAYTTNGLNNLDLANSNFDLGSRIIGIVSKEFRYGGGRFATSISLIYNGQSGQRISYLYSKTITNDDLSGATGNTMVYIPQNFAEANFVAFNRTVNGVTTSVTPQQQWSDFQLFVLTNKYLKDHIGRNTERNGDRLPWENHWDVRIAQDFMPIKGHKLELTLDILNVGNLFDKASGWSYNYGFQNYSGNLLTVASSNSNKPTFNFDLTKMNLIKGTYRAYSVSDYLSRWNAQIGFRYSF